MELVQNTGKVLYSHFLETGKKIHLPQVLKITKNLINISVGKVKHNVPFILSLSMAAFKGCPSEGRFCVI
jgi:hypothetical protein